MGSGVGEGISVGSSSRMRTATIAVLGVVCLICVISTAQGFSVDRNNAAQVRRKRSILDELIEPYVPEAKKKVKTQAAIDTAKAENATEDKKAAEEKATEKKTRALDEEFKKSLRKVKTNEEDGLEMLIRELAKELE